MCPEPPGSSPWGSPSAEGMAVGGSNRRPARSVSSHADEPSLPDGSGGHSTGSPALPLDIAAGRFGRLDALEFDQRRIFPRHRKGRADFAKPRPVGRGDRREPRRYAAQLVLGFALLTPNYTRCYAPPTYSMAVAVMSMFHQFDVIIERRSPDRRVPGTRGHREPDYPRRDPRTRLAMPRIPLRSIRGSGIFA
jgi:hypothetical protein